MDLLWDACLSVSPVHPLDERSPGYVMRGLPVSDFCDPYE